ncbi:glycoside hydrolase family 172 protein [Bacteroidota bacterium]
MKTLSNKTISVSLILCIIFLFSACNKSETSKTVSIESLLTEMTDRTVISEYPEPFFLCKQFSSYDRNSIGPDKDGWFANADYTWFVREENNEGRREFVMLDADGPGAIVRFWMTFAGEGAHDGILRIYIDGNEKPVIEGKAMKIISGGGLVGEPLSSSVSPESDYSRRGHNLYFPIPYSENCKITFENDSISIVGNRRKPSVYYNINYRTYNEGTNVESFSKEALKNAETLLQEVGEKIKKRDRGLEKINLKKHNLDGKISAGSEKLIKIKGKNAIRKLSFKIDADDPQQALRSTVIEMTFDGEKTVWSPLGDFFGTGYMIRPYSTWYNEVRANGTISCFWVMPFKKSCEIKLYNYGTQDVTISQSEIEYSSYKWNNNSMHFGAVWKEYTAIKSAGYSGTGGNDKHEDINYTFLNGEGVYVADAITVFNTVDAWWGEGDEKIYIDGEYLPSHIGTGTEDYFGYAWCRPEKFSHFLIAQPDGSGNFHPGYTLNLRQRILDGIPFTKSLKFDMELWHWVSTTMNYAPISFFYMKPGGKCEVEISVEAVQLPVVRKKTDLIKPVPDEDGIFEGENMVVVECSSGTHEIQSNNTWGWSHNNQLWWMDGKPGDYLILEFQSKEAGDFMLEGNFTKATDYGNFKLEINNKAWNGTFNGYNQNVVLNKINLGKFHLNKGTNKLLIKLAGKNQKAVPRYMVGIDCIKIIQP